VCFASGAAYGRFVGQALDYAHMLSTTGHTVPDRLGVYALVGASAMLAGMARITISLTVILIECTNDIQYAVAIMLCVMFAKWVADRFNHGLYDIHIHLKHVPLLEPFSEKEMYSIQARHIMSRRVETLPQFVKLSKIVEALTATGHSTFPVVTSDRGSIYLGTIRRDFLCTLLKKAGPSMLQMSTTDEAKEVVSWDLIQDVFPVYPRIKEATEWATEAQLDMYVNILPYTNTNAYTVRTNTSMRRVYTLFRGMGLRCLPVLELGSNECCGVITRQDMAQTNMDEALAMVAEEGDWMSQSASEFLEHGSSH